MHDVRFESGSAAITEHELRLPWSLFDPRVVPLVDITRIRQHTNRAGSGSLKIWCGRWRPVRITNWRVPELGSLLEHLIAARNALSEAKPLDRRAPGEYEVETWCRGTDV